MKKGSGVTPQMLARLPSNGVVVLNNLDDLEPMVVPDISESSYRDEDTINSISERLTNAFQIATGEDLPSQTTATAAAAQAASVKSGFAMVKDSIGGFLERWMDRHALKIIAKELTAGEIVRITSDEDNFKQLVDHVVLDQALKALDASFAAGYVPSPQEIQAEIASATEKMQKRDMFVPLTRDIIADELETQMYVTNEEMDTSVTVNNLLTMMKLAPQYADQIVQQTVDLMGLSPFKTPQQPQLPPQGVPQGAIPSPMNQGKQQQSIATNAATL